MCAQCMAGASLCVGSASGMRAWLAVRGWTWLTPKVMRRVTIALMSTAVLASSVLAGSGVPPATTAKDSLTPAAGNGRDAPAPAASTDERR